MNGWDKGLDVQLPVPPMAGEAPDYIYHYFQFKHMLRFHLAYLGLIRQCK